MRRISLIIILLFSINSFCQPSEKKETENIIGTYQAGTSEISSIYQDIYKFFANNKFEFEPTRYNGLNRIIKIAGKYKIENNKILFFVHSLTEIVGDKIERSMITTLSDSWAIDGGKLVTKKVKTSPQEASFELFKSNDNQNCLKIDDKLFYKINE